MQTWNPDCGKKTKFIYHPRARRTDAEPVMHKVNSLVIIGSFFILIYNENLPRPTAKEKIRRKTDTFSRAYEAAALQNQGRCFFAFILNQRRPNTV